MSAFVVALVLGAAVLHASWNALLKSGADRLRAMTVMCLAAALAALPAILLLPLPHPASWPYVAASAVLQIAYNIFLVRAYQQSVSEVVERHDGYVAQHLGDGMLVYFGFPAAHEDDRRRAVTTGLEICEAVAALDASGRLPAPVHVRVGIHTGFGVAGEVGGGARREQLVIGRTPNIAAHLQGLAATGQVVVSEATRRLVEGSAVLPWLVVEVDGRVAGYAYAAKHRARPAYRWSVETSIYVAPAQHRTGIARALYGALFGQLAALGYVNLYAGITLPNPASVGFHEALGFEPIGVYRGIGYKHGAWHDVGWWQRALGPRPDVPREPQSVASPLVVRSSSET